MIRVALLAAPIVLLCASAPAAAQSAATLYEQGTQARFEQRFDTAISLLERAVAQQPDNTDALVQLGFAYFGAGQPALAEPVFERVLVLAEGYEDARFGLAQARFRQGDRAGARMLAQRVVERQPDYRDAADLLVIIDQAVADDRLWRVDVSTEYSELSAGRGNWIDALVGLSYRASEQTSLALQLRNASRNGVSDQQATLRIATQVQPGIGLYGGLALAANASFLPHLSVDAGGDWRVLTGEAVGVTMGADIRHAIYDANRSTTLAVRAAISLFDGRLTLTPQWVHTLEDSGVQSDGFVLRADMAVTDAGTLFLGYANAPEISGNTLLDVQSVFGGVTVALSDAVTLRANAANEFRAAYQRTSIGLGASVRF
ncbi:YaiO family outer membrane beta-barrel protein [Devosia neptuniae]|jgi:YaiO family outer membrane protein|uniref:YaiO family outer membrane beta-barrel protein n=1 Tax=Devosia TaxID=46913 RepID=UPI0022AEB040|nr:YaiO family outer membrane beta-barrel protein [Devosia neptuniae]MCZ4346180.1 YaiO family outer membrane beta-barrel protein [Devosia neptuniae]|tara:strand:- start:38319 stop:39437 length:1119 start_codon:yes stop_codon:yes gene_type:complete